MDQWDEEVRTDRQTAGTEDGFGNILVTFTHSKPTKIPTEFLLSERLWERSGEGKGV